MIAASTLAGYMESHKLSLRVEQLEAFLRFITAARTEIHYTAAPVEEIVRKHGDMPFLKTCAENCQNGSSFTESWAAAVESGAKGFGLLEKDISLLRSFGDGFGASDMDGQLAHCKLFAELTETQLEHAREEKNRKSKLYLMLGIFAGMAVALLLC